MRFSEAEIESATELIWPIVNENYTYNAASIRTEINYQTYLGDYSKNYTYDDTYRLTVEKLIPVNWSQDYSYSYQYDPAGNRTFMIYTEASTTENSTFVYNDFNQLINVGTGGTTSTYYYDANGNLEGKSTPMQTGYTHNRDNKLVSVSGDYPGASYVYDAAGRKLMRIDEATGTKLKYYYDGINKLAVHEKPSGGAWRTKKVNFLKDASIGPIIADRTYSYSGGSTSTEDLWYHYDMLGNVTALSNNNSGVAAFYDMEAFGTVKTGSQDGVHLTTKEYDADTELYYFGARWYDPQTGRWLEKEPAGLDGPNLYHFNFLNAVTRWDPSGRASLLPPGIMLPGYAPAAAALCISAQGEAAGLAYSVNQGEINDKYGHCVAHCKVTRFCGKAASEAMSLGKEAFDAGKKYFDPGKPGWDPEDIGANKDGQAGADSCLSCEDYCAEKYSP